MVEEDVVQPLLVTASAIKQASECVRSILKIDDIVSFPKNFFIIQHIYFQVMSVR